MLLVLLHMVLGAATGFSAGTRVFASHLGVVSLATAPRDEDRQVHPFLLVGSRPEGALNRSEYGTEFSMIHAHEDGEAGVVPLRLGPSAGKVGEVVHVEADHDPLIFRGEL